MTGGDALGELLEASHLMSLDQLPGAVAAHAGRHGMHDVLIYLIDLQQNMLRLLQDRRGPASQSAGYATVPDDEVDDAGLRVEGTLAGRAYQHVEVAAGRSPDAGHHVWWLPLLDGTERLGVLRVATSDDGEDTLRAIRRLAALVALLLVSKRSHSDTYARLVRSQPMTVSAEMQWQLMPPLTFADDRVAISAVLEPAYELGGDALDYALSADTVHLAIFDAVGHDTFSGLTANLAVSACRNHRRQHTGLVETSQAIEDVLVRQFDAKRYVTALLAELDARTGQLTWISHGHPPPVIIRGGRWITDLECPPATPLGVDLGGAPTVCREQLQPGDRIMLYTDGITEARDAQGQEFGLQGFVDFIIRRSADGLPVPETLRRLIHGILRHHGGRLDDDATVLLCEWYGPPPATT